MPTFTTYVSPPDPRAELLQELLRSDRITSLFQPVVDLHTGLILGYEALSRGEGELAAPLAMFARARRSGCIPELDGACREAALARIARLGPELRDQVFFLNACPESLEDPRFVAGLERERLGTFGLSPRQIVIEVAECGLDGTTRLFADLKQRHADQGLRLALDGFGSGSTGLVTLIASTPSFIKLDRGLVSRVGRRGYAQKLLRSLVAVAESAGAELIATGVEYVDDLEALLRHGVRYAQGYLLGTPTPRPEPLAAPVHALVRLLRFETMPRMTDLRALSLRASFSPACA